jgi:hypothetical protein
MRAYQFGTHVMNIRLACGLRAAALTDPRHIDTAFGESLLRYKLWTRHFTNALFVSSRASLVLCRVYPSTPLWVLLNLVSTKKCNSRVSSLSYRRPNREQPTMFWNLLSFSDFIFRLCELLLDQVIGVYRDRSFCILFTDLSRYFPVAVLTLS